MAPKRPRDTNTKSVHSHQDSQAPTNQGKGTHTNTSNAYGIIFHDRTKKHRYKTLVARRLMNTRYLDNIILNTLGIFDDVYWMFAKVGWTQFVKMKYPTYERITLEILSSIEVYVLYGQGCTEGELTFRLFNEEHHMILAQFNMIYGFPCGGERCFPDDFREKQFWELLTTEF